MSITNTTALTNNSASLYQSFKSACSATLDGTDYVANSWPIRPFLRTTELAVIAALQSWGSTKFPKYPLKGIMIYSASALPVIDFFKYVRDSSTTSLALDAGSAVAMVITWACTPETPRRA